MISQKMNLLINQVSYRLLKPLENDQDYTSELKNPILIQKFIVKGYQVLVILTKSIIFINQIPSSQNASYVILLQYKTKFSVQYQSTEDSETGTKKINNSVPKAIFLESQQCQEKLKLELGNHQNLKMWIKCLNNKINQRDFQSDYQQTNQVIGKGGFGTVYLVKRRQDGKSFAVKKINKRNKQQKNRSSQGLQNQLKILRHVNHPNIIKLESVYQSNDHIYMVMQHFQRGCLLDLMNKNKFTVQQTKIISKNILNGLQYLKSQGIVHRDIKLQNILVRKDSLDVVITDFGLATFINTNKYIFTKCGTPGYAAPQLLGHLSLQLYKCNPISDIFSFGMIFHILLTGRHIFNAKNGQQMIQQTKMCNFNFQKSVYKNLPSAALDLLKRLVKKDPQKRIPLQKVFNHPYFTPQNSSQMIQKRLPKQNKNPQNQQSEAILQKTHKIKSFFQPINQCKEQQIKQLKRKVSKLIFTINHKQRIVILTRLFLFISQDVANPYSKHFVRLTFNIKFSVVYKQWWDINYDQPKSIILENQQLSQKVQLLSDDSQKLKLWISQLRKLINQRDIMQFYSFELSIAKSAMTKVILATRIQDQKIYAIKLYYKQYLRNNTKQQKGLQNQIYILRSINHRNIIHLQGVYQSDKSICLVLQHLSGLNLYQAIKTKLFNQQQIITILKSILNALVYLKTLNIVHRNLNQQTIMFRSNDYKQVVICNFALATFSNQQQYIFKKCGTPGFVAPQMLNLSNQQPYQCDSIGDMFAVGVIFHRLLLRQSIYKSTQLSQMIKQNRLCQFKFQQQKYKDLSSAALDLLKKMLEKEPSQRITAQEALLHQYFNVKIQNKGIIQEKGQKKHIKSIENTSQTDTIKIKTNKIDQSLSILSLMINNIEFIQFIFSYKQFAYIGDILIKQQQKLKHLYIQLICLSM